MVIYLLILMIILFLLALKVNNIVVLAVIFIYFATARAISVGVDSASYYSSFIYEISGRNYLDLLKKTEIGWLMLNLFVQQYFGDFQVVFFLASCLTILPIFYVFKKGTIYPVLSVLLYFLLYYYFFSYSIVRQAIAVSFFALSVFYFEKNQRIPAIIAIISAAIFHYSSIALIPIVLLLGRFNFSFRKYLVTFILSFILGFSGIMDIARSYMVYLPFEKYANYINYTQDAEFNRVTSYLFLLPKLVFFIYIYYQIDKNLYRVSSLQLKLVWLSMIINCLFLSVPQISRFTIYLSIFEVLLIVNTIGCAKNKKRLQIIFVTLAYASIYFVYYLLSNRFGVVPYVFG